MRAGVFKSPQERFWKFVTPGAEDSCWLWNGYVNGLGYGEFCWTTIPRMRVGAHVASWRIIRGEIPVDRQINHHCDVRNCVNPAHLYVGTQGDNLRDVSARNRWNPGRKMTPADVAEIRTSHETNVRLAARFGVDPAAISNVRLRKTYRHLP